MPAMTILGVDPGLHITGYGVLKCDDPAPGRVRLVQAGVIKANRADPLADRVRQIHVGLTEVIQQCQPTVLALEELFSHYRRPQTAILMGHARGVICLAAAQAGLSVHGYAATQVKKILTGSGRAPKEQVQRAVQRELGLSTIPTPNDVADALAIAMCDFFLNGPTVPSVRITSTRNNVA